MSQPNIRRINLKNTINLRELGGYMRRDGKVTKYNQFLRSGNPSRLDSDEIEFLLNYGLKTVVDLRNTKEITKEKSALNGIDGVSYFHLPLFDTGSPNIPEKHESLGDLYVSLFNYSTNFGNVFNAMAENSEGTIFFNCTAGKDRTGLIAAMLLMLAGVDEYDIIADYQVSFTYFKPAFEKTLEVHPNMPMHFAYSNPEWIENIMKMVAEGYGNIENYLIDRGATAKSLEILKDKLI